MNDWDSVSNATPPNSVTDPWDAVSTPDLAAAIERRRRRQQGQSIEEEEPQVIPPVMQASDNLVTGEPLEQSAAASDIAVPKRAFQEEELEDEIIEAPRREPKARAARAPVKRGGLKGSSIAIIVLCIAVTGLSVFTGLNMFHIGNFNNFNLATLTHVQPSSVVVNSNPAATVQAYATNAALQELYIQATNTTPATNDPLSDDRGRWGVFTTNWGGQCAFTGGAYHLSLSKAGYIIVCVGGSMGVLPNSANFALQVQINVVQGDEGGFYFGDAKAGSYGVFFNSSGTYTLYQYTRSDDKFHYFPPASNPAIKAGLNQVNVFTAIVRDSYLYLYANAQLITSDYLSAYEQGGGGFIVESPNQPTDVAFSSLKIWTF